MSQDSYDESTESERAAFEALPRSVPPSSALEERVVTALKDRGVLRGRGTPLLRFGVPIGALAAAGLLFAAGLAAGLRERSTAPADPRPQFVLFLEEGKDFDRGATPDAHVAEYKAWARDLGKRGLLVGGEKLKENGIFIERNGGETLSGEEALHDSTSAPRGYFVIRAENADQALSIAKDCPHIKHGGRISLRPIEKV